MEKFLVSWRAFGCAAFASQTQPQLPYDGMVSPSQTFILQFFELSMPTIDRVASTPNALRPITLTFNTKTVWGRNSLRRVVRRRYDVRRVSLSRIGDQKIDKLFPFHCPAGKWVITCDSHTVPWRGFERCTGHNRIFIYIFCAVRRRQCFFQFQGIRYIISMEFLPTSFVDRNAY